MTTQIKTPEAVLQAKGTFHLVKVKNKILVTILECIMFFIVFLGTGIAASFAQGFVQDLYAGAAGVPFDQVQTTPWYLPINLCTRLVMTIFTVVFCVVYQKFLFKHILRRAD